MLTEKVQAFAAQYIEMMTPYYKDLQKFLQAYQVKVMEQYNKMSNKMTKQFQQMSEQAIAQYKTLSTMAVAKFEKFAAEMKAKYGKDFDKVYLVTVFVVVGAEIKMKAKYGEDFDKVYPIGEKIVGLKISRHNF